MKILNEIKVIVLCGLRDYRTMLMMCLLPIILILILGSALGDIMASDEDFEVGKIEFEYAAKGGDSIALSSFKGMVSDFDAADIEAVQSDDIEKSKQKVKDRKLTCAIEIAEDEITIYKSESESIEGTVIEVIVSSFCSTYNTYAVIADIKPQAMADIAVDEYQSGFVDVEGVSKNRQPTAMEYYGILMTVLFCLYGLMEPVFGKIARKESYVITRASIAPVKPITYFLGEILGYYAINVIRFLIVFTCTIVLFDVYWGEPFIYSLIMMLSLNFMMVSGGVLLGDIFKRQEAANGIIQIFIVASAFLGGAYLPLDQIGKVGEIGKFFSVIWWANTGIVNHVFSGDNANMIAGTTAYLIFAAVFLMIGVLRIRAKEAK